ncbi:hypothetical protein [Paracoccus sp. PAR01]|uniref:hypothetical protein n=1 Tax=Paracoccus sp. PAR01 TaxID=2769282 RepID=UPI001786AEC2|nr:hypothetical protein [Paracoccus sp. PAR01]MBD9527830.1 hypothetical protein [Paracoccus sp. PAR01]
MLDDRSPQRATHETRDPTSGRFRATKTDYLRVARAFRQERLPGLRAENATPTQIEAACFRFKASSGVASAAKKKKETNPALTST